LILKSETHRDTLRRAFVQIVGGCDIQDGWPCRTCFFDTMSRLGIEGEEAHAFWLIQLRLRNNGDRVEGLYRVRVDKTLMAQLHDMRIWFYQRWGKK
jgi:hypothetical protein